MRGTMKAKKKPQDFRELLTKYLDIKGLDIVVLLNNGCEVELYKNRELIDDTIITFDTDNNRKQILLSEIKSVDLYAA